MLNFHCHVIPYYALGIITLLETSQSTKEMIIRMINMIVSMLVVVIGVYVFGHCYGKR